TTLLQIFGKYLPMVIGCVSAVLHCILFFLICLKSPPSLDPYKNLLLFVTVISCLFDISFNILVAPAPLPGTHGVHFLGVLGYRFQENGFEITQCLVSLISIL
ncbi:hypothetical protein PENTCL1PPCAC_29938, partial [Pristionchus entomophagus]